jgi:hypothetical protein
MHAPKRLFFTTASGFCLVLFCLDAKKNQKKSRQNPIAPRVFAIPRLPMCSSACIYFLSSCVMVYHGLFIFFSAVACAVSTNSKLPI